jgi:dTDP-4-dehydrorhamnose reductase
MTPKNVAFAVQVHKPDAVINAAAWTDVDAAETFEADATTLNAISPAVISGECSRLGIPFLHISTDYVFDGSGVMPYKISDATDPKSAYGRSKLRGELAIRQSGSHYFILRTSWVFSAHGKNFVKTIVRLGREREALRVVNDQIGGPTPASAIADTLIYITKKMHAGQAGGIYHFSGFPDVSWSDFASRIMSMSHSDCRILGIPSSDYPTPATRPKNSRLDCTNIERDFGIRRPDWRQALNDVLIELE